MSASRVRDGWIRSFPLPWVVCDLNILRGMKRGAGFPGRASIIIPDRLFLEIAGADKKDELVQKIESIIHAPGNHGRLLIGRYWGELARSERRPTLVRSGSVAAISPNYSAIVRQMQRNGDGFNFDNEGLEEDIADDEHSKEVFNQTGHDLLMAARADLPNLPKDLQGKPKAIAKLVDTPAGFVWETARLLPKVGGKYNTEAWRRFLWRRPIRSAFGRWLMVVLVYLLRRQVSPDIKDDKTKQDYDDAFYVFLSLYTNHLLTDDKWMIRAASLASGGKVKVYRSLDELHEGYK